MRIIDETAIGAGGRSCAATPRPQTGTFARDWPAFWRRLQSRRALARLSDQHLADVGLTRAEAEREVRLPFWKL